MKTFRWILVICISFFMLAAKSPIMRVQGKILSFSEKSVVLQSKEQQIEVPRNFIGAKKLKVGETVEAAFNESEQKKIKLRSKAK